MSMLKAIAEEEVEMEMTPMIDVTFLLLIFFMCTIKFKTLEGRLSAYLPKDVGVNSEPSEVIEKVEITVTVLAPGEKMSAEDKSKPWTGDGRFVFQGRKLQYKVGPNAYTDPEEMTKKLRKAFLDDETRPVTIYARNGTVYGDIVVVLDGAIQAGFKDITFGGAEKK